MAALTLALSIALGAGFNDSLDRFPIGFWNYAPIAVFDEAKIQEWQDAGMTLTMGPEYAATPENVAHMKQILGWADARGIKVIVCDPRTRAKTPMPSDFAKQAREAVADFGGFASTFGFHVLDEPDKAQFQPTCDAVKGVQEAGPGLAPFVNLLPWHDEIGPRIGYDDFQKYLDDFVKTSGVKFLCYDCYSQMNPKQAGWPIYFRNLREYHEAAKRNGIPFWTTILSVGHFHYKPPTEDDIRWQFNSAVAYGAQGILYFFFYQRQPHDNYRPAAGRRVLGAHADLRCAQAHEQGIRQALRPIVPGSRTAESDAVSRTRRGLREVRAGRSGRRRERRWQSAPDRVPFRGQTRAALGRLGEQQHRGKHAGQGHFQGSQDDGLPVQLGRPRGSRGPGEV